MSNVQERAPAPVAAGPDEISLRDLFLVIRRRWWHILLASLLLAAGVFIYLNTRPAVYLATSATAVSRASVGLQPPSNLVLRSEVELSFDAYQALAYGAGVLGQVAELLPEGQRDPQGLRSMLQLERLVGSSNATQVSALLVVEHGVRSRDPELAARLANAWAEATLAAVQDMVLENLQTARRFGDETLQAAMAQLEQSEAALLAYGSRSEVLAEPLRLQRLQTQLDDVYLRLGLARQMLPVRRAELDSLRSRLTEDPQALVVLSDAPEVPLTVQGAVWSLEAKLAAALAEEEALSTEYQAAETELARLGATVAAQQQQLRVLRREADEALGRVQALSPIGPATDDLTQLAGDGLRLLNTAEVPERAVGRQALLFGVLAFLAAAMAGVVFVLLAEAVRAPEAAD